MNKIEDKICDYCDMHCHLRPKDLCSNVYHWKDYALIITSKFEQHDDIRDKLDVTEFLKTYKKTDDYSCHGCQRKYQLPTHIDHFTCVCGHACRLRHVGGINPDQEIIDAAIEYFGNERMAQLSWIAEIIGGQFHTSLSGDQIRKMIRDELDRWEKTELGWKKKKP